MTSQLPAASLLLFFVGFRPFSPALCSLHAHTETHTGTCYDMHNLPMYIRACGLICGFLVDSIVSGQETANPAGSDPVRDLQLILSDRLLLGHGK